jgi:hypothetical protein
MDILEFQEWEQGEPQFSDPAVFTSAFKAAVQAGHFVKVLVHGTMQYGRIVATSHSLNNINIDEQQLLEGLPVEGLSGYLKLNWYCTRESLNVNNNIIPASASNAYTSSVVELFQTTWFNWIHSSCVRELIFVFHFSDVISGNYCCSGMENVFFIRYRYIHDTAKFVALERT